MLYRLREAGYAVDVAAPQRKRLALVVHDFEPGGDTYVERPGRSLEADLAFADVDPPRYVALLIPGGRAPEVIRGDADVRRIVAHFFDNDLPVGHMCHGVQVPAAFGYVRGRRVSAFPPLAVDIEAAGGEFVEGPDVVDGTMVSATGWTTSPNGRGRSWRFCSGLLFRPSAPVDLRGRSNPPPPKTGLPCPAAICNPRPRRSMNRIALAAGTALAALAFAAQSVP